MALKQAKVSGKADRFIKILGCSYGEFKEHIQSQFRPGMTWDLFLSGKLHLDHVKPVAAFDMSDPEQQRAAFHFSNVKPEWPEPNLTKHSHWNGRHWKHSDHRTWSHADHACQTQP